MTRLVRAELLKLSTTRLLLWLGLLILALEVLVIALHVSKDSLGSLAEPRSQRDVVSIAASSALIALIWLFVGEPLLSLAGVEKYGPGHAIASVVEAGNQGAGLLGFGAGLAVALVYVVVAGALGGDSLKRADIT